MPPPVVYKWYWDHECEDQDAKGQQLRIRQREFGSQQFVSCCALCVQCSDLSQNSTDQRWRHQTLSQQDVHIHAYQ